MAILNLGSCCIDHVYQVPEFVRPGETLPCSSYKIHPGGKGLNQSIAAAKAGAEVIHAGKIGTDGQWLATVLQDAGVGIQKLVISDEPTGHANIQVNDAGENAIVLFGGTNRQITRDEIDASLEGFSAGDFLMLQNEISELSYAMEAAASKGMKIVFNAAPMTADVADLPLETLNTLLVNEIEGAAISGVQDPAAILSALQSLYPAMHIVLTLGAAGAHYIGPEGAFQVNAPAVEVVDTTGAGDTFTGYFVAGISGGLEVQSALTQACQAAAISVTRAGAASSIPDIGDIKKAAT